MDNVLITSRGGALDEAAARAAADDAAARLRTVVGVASVGQPVTARDGSALLLPITMSGDPETASERVQPLRDATAGVQAEHPQLRVEQVGGPSIGQALDDTLGKDFKRAELLSLPVTLAILIIAFGALIAASVPVLLALSSVAAAMGLSTLASHLVPATDTTATGDPADRHGGRGRLLAVLHPSGAGGTGQGPHPASTPWRSPRRPPDTRWWSPASR